MGLPKFRHKKPKVDDYINVDVLTIKDRVKKNDTWLWDYYHSTGGHPNLIVSNKKSSIKGDIKCPKKTSY